MKLYYYRDPSGLKNFGDDLNAWLWPQLAPRLFDDDEREILVGIGTLLNDHLHRHLPERCGRVAVFSSGVGYGNALPTLDQRWKIYCVRGPLSARALGVSESLALTDGAVLVRRVYSGGSQKGHRFSYMPHASHARAAAGDWERLCHNIDFGYVDARWPIERVLRAISSTEVLLTEAMHGAVVADALRIPWIPVHSTNLILNFKWQDWCMSVGVDYKPKHVLPLWALPEPKGRARVVRQLVKQNLAAAQLLKIAKMTKPSLSNSSRIEDLMRCLEHKLVQLRSDSESGR